VLYQEATEVEADDQAADAAVAGVWPPSSYGGGCAINVKPLLPNHRCHGRLTTPFMVQRRLTRTNVPRLGPCLAALRVLASSKGPHRHVLIERQIDEYLRNDPFSLAHALERLRRAIQYEELERREGEDWSVAKDYVRSLLRRMTS
jgi:hypothetical protein